MSLLNFLIDTESVKSAQRMEEIARENEEMRIQSEEDVREFLADQKAGRTHSMMEASGNVGKGIAGLMMVLSLASVFGSYAQRAMAEKPETPAATQTQQIQVQPRNEALRTQTFTLTR